MKSLDYIAKYWVILAFLVSGISTVAIGGQKIKNLEEAIKKQTEQNIQVQELKTEQKVLVERTKTMLDQMKEQKLDAKEQQRLLMQILIKLEQPE